MIAINSIFIIYFVGVIAVFIHLLTILNEPKRRHLLYGRQYSTALSAIVVVSIGWPFFLILEICDTLFGDKDQ
jgi:uncharacterized membrane protein